MLRAWLRESSLAEGGGGSGVLQCPCRRPGRLVRSEDDNERISERSMMLETISFSE